MLRGGCLILLVNSSIISILPNGRVALFFSLLAGMHPGLMASANLQQQQRALIDMMPKTQHQQYEIDEDQ